MATLPAPPHALAYAPQALAAAWVVAEVGFVWVTGIASYDESSAGLEAILAPVAFTAALPATLVVTWMYALCAVAPPRKKWRWIGMSTALFGLTAGLFAKQLAIAVVPLGFAFGNAVWFFAFRAFGRGVLLMRGKEQDQRPERLSTRKIMILTLSVSVIAAIIRWLSKLSSDDADLAMVGAVAIGVGAMTGGCSLSLTFAIMKPHWAWYLIHFVAVLLTGAVLFTLAMLFFKRPQMSEVVSAAAAWLMTLFHLVIFLGILRTSGYRIRVA